MLTESTQPLFGKHAEILKLVTKLRSNMRLTYKDTEYRAPHDYGYLDDIGQMVYPYNVDWVSPYSLAFEANPPNLEAQVMVMAQDWTSHESLVKYSTMADLQKAHPNLWYTPTLATNQRLSRFLKYLEQDDPSKMFFTNLFPYIKSGGLSAGIPAGLMREMAEKYAKEQINIIRPKLVICLGLATYNALRSAYGFDERDSMKDAMDGEDGGFFMVGSSQIWCQAHTGARGWSNRNKGRAVDANGDRQVHRDWRRMAAVVCGKVSNEG
jgi:restriction system protein